MTRPYAKGGRGQTTRSVRRIDIGQHDPMSRLARQAGLPLCGWRDCTRAAGHDEGADDGMRGGSRHHPASLHVVAGDDHRARAIWPAS